MAVRAASGKTLEDFANERGARFSLYPNPNTEEEVNTADMFVKPSQGTFMDLLMSEIPGMLDTTDHI